MDRVQKWKAGDVAMLVTESGAEHVGMVVTTGLSIGVIAPTYQALSAIHRDRRDAVIYAWGPSAIRPLVVIDPEDREQVERLTRIYYGDKDGGPTPHDDRMQAALREFANPTPPIEEPQGLGAVVIDANDHRWLRGNTDADDEEPWYSDQFGWESWSEINATRVLSEGIPAEAKS